MDSLAFIDKNGKVKRQPYYVLSGDEDFLRRRVLSLLVPVVLGDADPDYAVSTFPGDKTDFSAVRNELDSVSFFSERRLVIVEQADAFVTKFRPQLEAYMAEPSEKGVLGSRREVVPLEHKAGESGSGSVSYRLRFAEGVSPAALVCRVVPVAVWQENNDASAQMLVELVGDDGRARPGVAKLKDFVGDRPAIDVKDVDELTGRSRGANVFKIMDAVGDGQPKIAIKILTELFEEGEEPLKLLGALGYQLRKLARVARIHKQGLGLDEALGKAGVPNFPQARDGAKKQLKHLGWGRLDKLYDWLLEVDSGLKGGNPLPERLQMERLVVRLARPRPN